MSKLPLLLKFIERHNDDPNALKAAEAAYALANGNAKIHPVPGEDRTVIHCLNQCGSYSWDATPPLDVSPFIHQQSFLAAIEWASTVLGTDHTRTIETLVCGGVIKHIALNSPRFKPYTSLPEPLPAVGRCVYLGALSRRFVLFDPDLKDNHGFLTSGDNRVFIEVLNHGFIYSRPFSGV